MDAVNKRDEASLWWCLVPTQVGSRYCFSARMRRARRLLRSCHIDSSARSTPVITISRVLCFEQPA